MKVTLSILNESVPHVRRFDPKDYNAPNSFMITTRRSRLPPSAIKLFQSTRVNCSKAKHVPQ